MKKRSVKTFYMRQVDQAAFAFSIASSLILTIAVSALLAGAH